MKKVLLFIFVLALFIGLSSPVSYAGNNSNYKAFLSSPTGNNNSVKTFFTPINKGKVKMYNIVPRKNGTLYRFYDPQTNVMCYVAASNGSETIKAISCVQLSPKK